MDKLYSWKFKGMARDGNIVDIEVCANQRSTAWVAAAECLSRYSSSFISLHLVSSEECKIVKE